MHKVWIVQDIDCVSDFEFVCSVFFLAVILDFEREGAL